MPKTREQIKHDPVSSEVWRNNRTQVGGLWFDPRKIQPTGNHILVELDGDPGIPGCIPMTPLIAKPDIARGTDIGTRIGTVLAVGPGKWQEKRNHSESWILNPLEFKPVTLRPRDRVVIGHYSDWESWSSDYEFRDLNIVLCQEADVRLFEPHDCEIIVGGICIECERERLNIGDRVTIENKLRLPEEADVRLYESRVPVD